MERIRTWPQQTRKLLAKLAHLKQPARLQTAILFYYSLLLALFLLLLRHGLPTFLMIPAMLLLLCLLSYGFSGL